DLLRGDAHRAVRTGSRPSATFRAIAGLRWRKAFSVLASPPQVGSAVRAVAATARETRHSSAPLRYLGRALSAGGCPPPLARELPRASAADIHRAAASPVSAARWRSAAASAPCDRGRPASGGFRGFYPRGESF